MKIKHISSATLETMVKWAIDKQSTSIFVACINKIQKQSVERGIDPVIVLALAAYDSNFGKFDSMYNESYCNLFRTLKETDDMIVVKRYKTWSDGISEFLDTVEKDIEDKGIQDLEELIELPEYKKIIVGYAMEIVNTHIEPSTIRISTDIKDSLTDDKDNEIKDLNDKLMELQTIIGKKDEKILALEKVNEDLEEEIKVVDSFKETLKDFLK